MSALDRDAVFKKQRSKPDNKVRFQPRLERLAELLIRGLRLSGPGKRPKASFRMVPTRPNRHKHVACPHCACMSHDDGCMSDLGDGDALGVFGPDGSPMVAVSDSGNHCADQTQGAPIDDLRLLARRLCI